MDHQEKDNKQNATPDKNPQDKRAQAKNDLDDLMRVLDEAQGNKPKSKISHVEVGKPRTSHQTKTEPAKKETKSERPKQEETSAQWDQKETRPQGAKTQRRKEPRKQAPAAAVPPQSAAARRREREAKRRKRRMVRTAMVVIIAILILIAVVAIIRGIAGVAKNHAQDAAGSGSGVVAQETQVDTSLPASQQESEQYLAIKDDADLPDYAKLYPGMYADAVSVENTESEEKVCYLTFDDGPSSTVTPDILDTLKENDVKATFFLVTSTIQDNGDLVKRMADEGHTICIHCNTHSYGDLYTSVEDYLADFAEAYDTIYELTGQRVQGFRFPGGSNNAVMERDGTYDEIVGEMTRRGFEYYDWNAYDHDSENGDYTTEQMVNYAVDEVMQSSRTDAILLMHDTYGKEQTAEALPSIIKKLKAEGIEMKPITNSSRPVHFEVSDSTPPEFPTADSDTETSDSGSDSESDSDTYTNSEGDET